MSGRKRLVAGVILHREGRVLLQHGDEGRVVELSTIL